MNAQTFYGICPLSIVPVRLEPAEKGEIGTQLLFGDIFSSNKKSEDGKWVFIKIEYDQYAGWIDAKQYQEISKNFFEELSLQNSPLSKDLISYVNIKNKNIPILYGSVLPFLNNGIIDLENQTHLFQGQSIVPLALQDFHILEKFAIKYLGAPYLWGGKTPFGIDCSGFVQQVFRFCGYKLPRDAYQQAEVGETISFEKSLPGDIAYFNNAQGRIMHVGIIFENSQIMHASGEVRMDTLDKIGIFNKEKNTYTHKLSHIKRIIY